MNISIYGKRDTYVQVLMYICTFYTYGERDTYVYMYIHIYMIPYIYIHIYTYIYIYMAPAGGPSLADRPGPGGWIASWLAA